MLCVVIVGISSVCMISADVGRNEIERVENKVQEKTFYIRSLQADTEMLANAEPDTEVKAELLRLAEKIRFSDPMSHERLADLENQITDKVTELKSSTERTVIINEINSLLDERNKKCKILK